jgi:hypothetical protein
MARIVIVEYGGKRVEALMCEENRVVFAWKDPVSADLRAMTAAVAPAPDADNERQLLKESVRPSSDFGGDLTSDVRQLEQHLAVSLLPRTRQRAAGGSGRRIYSQR